MTNFSNNLKRIRKEKGLSQATVAEQISSSLTQVRRWESAETSPSIDNAALLAKCYNVSLDELYGLAKNKQVVDLSNLNNKQVKAVKAVLEAFG